MVRYEQTETRKLERFASRRKIQRRGAERFDHRVCGFTSEKLRLRNARGDREEEGQGNQEVGHQKTDHL